MDRSECKRLVEERIEPLMEMFGIPQWTIRVEYKQLDDPAGTCLGEVSILHDYDKATIRLNFDALDNADELSEVLIHELLHILLSPLDVYRQVMTQDLVDGSKEDLQEKRLHTHVMEKAVINLERLYRGVKKHYTKEDIFKHVPSSSSDSGKRERTDKAEYDRECGLPGGHAGDPGRLCGYGAV